MLHITGRIDPETGEPERIRIPAMSARSDHVAQELRGYTLGQLKPRTTAPRAGVTVKYKGMEI